MTKMDLLELNEYSCMQGFYRCHLDFVLLGTGNRISEQQKLVTRLQSDSHIQGAVSY